MNNEPTIQELEERVKWLLENVETLKMCIESHEFDQAAVRAEYISRWCRATNVMANRIADND